MTGSRRGAARKIANGLLRGVSPVWIMIDLQHQSTRRTYLNIAFIRMAKAIGPADGAHVARGKRWSHRAWKILRIDKTVYEGRKG
jgi:hypothetical protein